MRWRSDALVKPRHALAAYVRRATTVAWYIDVLQSRSVQSVAAQHSQRVICLCARRHESLNVLSDREVVCSLAVSYCCLVLPSICIALLPRLGHASGGARVSIPTSCGSGLLRHGLNFSRSRCMMRFISGEKDWKHISMQKVVTLSTCCDVACLTSQLPLITTSQPVLFRATNANPQPALFRAINI